MSQIISLTFSTVSLLHLQLSVLFIVIVKSIDSIFIIEKLGYQGGRIDLLRETSKN